MTTSLRLAAFLAGIVAAITIGYGVGNAVGPFSDRPPPAHTAHEMDQP